MVETWRPIIHDPPIVSFVDHPRYITEYSPLWIETYTLHDSVSQDSTAATAGDIAGALDTGVGRPSKTDGIGSLDRLRAHLKWEMSESRCDIMGTANLETIDRVRDGQLHPTNERAS